MRQIEQIIGRPKQRQFGRLDELFNALCRFDLVAMLPSSWQDGWRVAFSARRVSSLRRSGDSVVTRPTLTPLPAFVSSQSTLSLVRHTLGFNVCSVLRAVFSHSPWIFSDFISVKMWDCCGADFSRFSSAPTDVLFDNGPYNSQYYHLSIFVESMPKMEIVLVFTWVYLWKICPKWKSS